MTIITESQAVNYLNRIAKNEIESDGRTSGFYHEDGSIIAFNSSLEFKQVSTLSEALKFVGK